MKNAKLAASVLAVSMLATSVLAGCDNTNNNSSNNNSSSNNSSDNSSTNSGSGEENILDANAAWKQTLSYADGTTLRMACGYNKANTGMRFDAATAGEGVTLADGKTYHTGDFKPTWAAVMDKLKFKIDDQYRGNTAAKEWEAWKDQLDQIDFVAGSATTLSAAGNDGMLLNIANYLDSMPYFNAYLKRNPIVRLSITASTTGTTAGAIYFSPYFDGVNDIERMPLMRADWVVKLLDGKDEFNPAASGTTKAVAYTPYMPTSGKVEVDVVKKDGSGTEKITKDYDKAGNIVAKMNEVGTMSGKDAVKMLRTYIDEAYGGYYGETRSDLFVGQNAAWDADELVALLRCVVSNAQELNGTDTINGLFSREDSNNQRRVDMFRFAGTLFGVRGLESRQDYLYVGNDNKLHDARMEEDTYKALERMNAMAKEGLIAESFVTGTDTSAKSESMLEKDLGFMSYDYNQTQTLFNDTKLQDGEKYMAAMVPVAIWDDGTGKKYMRFTESWRSVKTDGWAISLAGLGYSKANPAPKKASELNDKAKALLTLIDYAYSKEGQILMSYGPEAFIKGTETFNFNGEQWPVISDACAEGLKTLGKGNYTNYARQYIGSTLSFAKSQAFEYQCTTAVGKEGAAYISKAIALKTIKHPELALASNAWYTSVPTVLPSTSKETENINSYKNLSTMFSSKAKEQNVLVDLIVKGFTEAGYTSTAEAAKTVTEEYGGKNALELRNAAWSRLTDYYKTLNG